MVRARRHAMSWQLPDELAVAEAGAVLVAGAELAEQRIVGRASGVIAAKITARQIRFDRTALDGASLDGLDGTDLIWSGCELSGLRLVDAALQRVAFHDCRLTGSSFAEAVVVEFAAENCKLDLANFRFAKLEGAVFRDCVLSDADFGECDLRNARLERCNLAGAQFSGARMRGCDLRGCNLSGVVGAASLRGAVINSEQLIELSPILAAEIGIEVRDDTQRDESSE